MIERLVGRSRYPEEARSAILDALFKPGHLAALQILKVEIGCALVCPILRQLLDQPDNENHPLVPTSAGAMLTARREANRRMSTPQAR